MEQLCTLCRDGAECLNFKCRLDKHWECQAIKYNYRATVTGNGNRSLSQLDLDLTIKA